MKGRSRYKDHLEAKRFTHSNGDNEEAHSYVHEEDWIESESLPPRIDGRAHERISSPRAPNQSNSNNDEFDHWMVL